MIKKILYILVASFLLLGTAAFFYSAFLRRIKLSKPSPPINQSREAKALTAFFGLDELPLQSILLHPLAAGKNGMPVVFSQEIDPGTLEPSDFEVVSKNNHKYSVDFVTLKPANEEFELRTVLLIGENGSYPDNPPIRVNIIGELLSRSGQNYQGQSLEVIPLPEGPTISYAEYFQIDANYPYVKRGMGCDCPKEETEMVVRTVWAGGVRALNGNQLGDNELDGFLVTMVNGSDTFTCQPFQLADLFDGDNNIDLCLKEKGIPVWVEAKENIAIDPRNDANPKTQSEIVSRW